ncbi:Methyltransferase domain-containing protein [Dyella sp. OK004]|uniref:class I SAM-dependent methyltransferase n=1 Tax=Dyella sp. OK004 TaxID=1855292 RepID=UPI0008E5B2C7|nr:class I SAM-dependent methyltransferase [Dyella sp. OK004]SFS05930.1 Methyltransferase domain-containing protein [Dyella sp. OK004]
MGTDHDWENWGRNDPYFGVLSHESFRAENISNESRDAFFLSGERHIESLLDTIRAHFKPQFTPDRSLDFGCGVGRLLIPLARRSQHASGVDVSTAMLTEAHRNCEIHAINNVKLLRSDDHLSQVRGEYDLIHSHIVFAHIDPRRGQAIIEALADRISPDGFIAIQILYSCNASPLIRSLVKLRYKLPLLNTARNLMRGRPLREPPMQLHVYNLPMVLRTLNRLGFSKTLLTTDKFDNEQFDSVTLIAQRSPALSA